MAKYTTYYWQPHGGLRHACEGDKPDSVDQLVPAFCGKEITAGVVPTEQWWWPTCDGCHHEVKILVGAPEESAELLSMSASFQRLLAKAITKLRKSRDRESIEAALDQATTAANRWLLTLTDPLEQERKMVQVGQRIVKAYITATNTLTPPNQQCA